MRKVKVTIQLLIIVAFVLFINGSFQNVNEVSATTLSNSSNIYAAPVISPFGKIMSIEKNVDFYPGSHDWIENDDWDWDTLAMSYRHTNESNPKLEIIPIGANNHSSFEVWVPSGNMAGVTGFMFYVDYSNLLDSTNIRMYMRFSTSTGAPTGDISLLTSRYLNAGVNCYYYDYLTGEWIVTVTEADSYFSLPDSFRGYVYIPLSNYNDVQVDGVGLGDYNLQMYHFDMSAGSLEENVAPIYLDNIQLLKENYEHTHSYTLKGTLNPSCTQKGLDLYSCTCGQVKWANLTDEVAHDIGEKHYCSEGLSSALCQSCNKLIYFEEETNLKWDEAVSVTYHYNHDELETKIYEYPKGYTMNVKDVPWAFQVHVGYNMWQFFRYTIDEVGLYGKNPIGLQLEEDLELYAQYNNTHAEQKYRAMISDVSFNGGPYEEETYKEQVIFVGQSNFSLWHNMENWYANKGVPVRNNSIAGATSHVYVEFVEELVLMYDPKIVVCIVSSNE